MKYCFTVFICFVFIVFVENIKAQPLTTNVPSVFGTYRWIHEVVLVPCTISGDSTGEEPVTSLPGQLFRVVNIKDKTYVIRILDYKEATKPPAGGSSSIKEDYYEKFNQRAAAVTNNGKTIADKQKYFLISADMLPLAAFKIELEKPSLVAGIISLPFKFRLQDGDFNGNFNIGAAGGWRFHHYTSRPAFSLLGAASVSTINLDTATVTRNKNEILGTNSLAALTLSVGGMLELGKVQAGIFIGFDWLSRLNNQKFGWRYQGKPWFSFGIGYTIFGAEKKDSDNTQGNEVPNKKP